MGQRDLSGAISYALGNNQVCSGRLNSEGLDNRPIRRMMRTEDTVCLLGNRFATATRS